jgi:hypothetical protein
VTVAAAGLVEHVLNPALLIAVERDDANRLRWQNSKANCRKTVRRRRLLSLQIVLSAPSVRDVRTSSLLM